MPTAQMNKHYSYKDIHNHIYLIRIDQTKQIIRIYNVCFYKDNLEIRNSLENKIYKTIFDEFNEEEKNDIQISIQRL